MRAFVFTDQALSGQAGRFVWLAWNTERSENAALNRPFPVDALPTFFVVDPTTEKVALRWVGGATVAQMTKLLDDGRAAVAAGPGAAPRAAGPGAGADRAFASADAAYGRNDYASAAKGYADALAAAPPGWKHDARAVESRLYALTRLDDNVAASALARDAFPRLRHTPSAANVAATGLDAALALPADQSGRAELVATLEADARAVLADRALAVAADDRSAVFGSLIDARDDARDSTGSRRVTLAWSAFLDSVAAKAPTADARAVFDSHRLSAYLALGEPERAVPMLEASERALPDDYNPPARLATAYKAMKRWDDAAVASDRALAKAYGPRRLLVLRTRADIELGRADTTAARRVLSEALTTAKGFPEGQRSDRSIAAIQKSLDALGR